MAKSTTARPPRALSPLVQLELILWNGGNILAWSYVLFRCWKHMAGGDGYTGLKELISGQSLLETLDKRSRTGFNECVPLSFR
jgi:hypothetical protein